MINFFINILNSVWEIFEDFDTDNEDRPKLIYKYRSWNNNFHKKTLLENSLYLASPDLFNDPFDCKIYRNYLSLNTKYKIRKYVEKVIKNEDYETTEKLKKQRQILIDNLSDLEKFQQKSEKVDDKITNLHLGIISFSRRWNSILMWSHYANFHKGFCIGLDEKKLRNSLENAECGKVMYRKRFPRISPLGNDNEVALLKPFYKSKEWKYEEEYRIVAISTEKEFNRNLIFPKNCIKEIILGMNIPTMDKEEIIKYAKKRNIDVYQTEKIPFKFQLERKKIE